MVLRNWHARIWEKFKSPVSVMGQIIFELPCKLVKFLRNCFKSEEDAQIFSTKKLWFSQADVLDSNYRSIILKIISACLPIFLGHCQTFWCIVLKVFGLTILKNGKFFKVNFHFRSRSFNLIPNNTYEIQTILSFFSRLCICTMLQKLSKCEV